MDIIRIGRSSDNDEVFSQGEVSRHHCELYCENMKVFIRDLGSSNGTRVNGKIITEPVWLKKGDRVVLGYSVEIDWYKIWSKYYNYSVKLGDVDKQETIRFGATIKKDESAYENKSNKPQRPIVDIPSSIHIKKDYAEVMKKGDDFQVPFRRNLGDKMGNLLGSTAGCIGSILMVAAFLLIMGLIISTCS